MNNSFRPTCELLRSQVIAQAALRARAANATQTRLGRRVFLRGVVEVSNHCRDNCVYCGMRRDNRALARFHARHDKLAGKPEIGDWRGLRTGANLVTINLTPAELRDDYLLSKRDRFIMTEERILTTIAAERLTPSQRSLVDFYRDGRTTNGVPELAASETAAV